jgi:dimethylargininase
MQECELTYLPRTRIDLRRARMQHHEYEKALEDLGCRVTLLPAEPDLPDSVFVEDTAVVLDRVAVITRPGAVSRRAETGSIASALEPYRELRFIQSPGTLDGGDVLRVGRTLYVGISTRSGERGIEQLGQAVAPFGYTVRPVPVNGCLHLKSAVTQVGPDALLINRAWANPADFQGMQIIDVDPFEPFGANAIWMGDCTIYPASWERTRNRLEKEGIKIQTVDVSELEKAEGAVTCCSLIFEASIR